jgi:hypothetical protein
MSGLRFRGLWLVPIILGIACQVSACPVCGVGRDGTASVYLMTAVLMSAVPLVMAGAMAYYLIRRAKHDHRQQHERASMPPIPPQGPGQRFSSNRTGIDTHMATACRPRQAG